MLRAASRTPDFSNLGAYEIWTQHRVYTLDADRFCVSVRVIGTETETTAHRCVGARLSGGRRRNGEQVQLSFPLPDIGARALFDTDGDEEGGGILTSAVTRVVQRNHEVRLSSKVA